MTTKSGKTVTLAVPDSDSSDDEGIVITFNSIGRGTVRRRASTRSRRCQPTTTTATLVHTSRRGSDTYLEVLPDLTQGVDEEETWEKLQQIRAHAVPMEEKRKLKRQLQSAPTLRTKGLAAFKLSRRKFLSQAKSRLREMISKIELWHWSLRYVEGNFGTGLVAFFTFIKWLLYLNLFTCVLLAVFILVPQIVLIHPEDSCAPETNQSLGLENETLSIKNDSLCCFEVYRLTVLEESSTLPNALTEPTQIVELILDGVKGTGVLELSYLFYGFYPRDILILDKTRGWNYNLPLAYLLVVVVTLVLSLVLMVRAAARGLRESLRSSEGQFYQYCNLIFGGWDYCIENNKAAATKKKAIYNELCNHLETERYNDEKEQRTKRERCRLYFVRLLINLVVVVLLSGSLMAIFYSTTYAFNELKKLKSNSEEREEEDLEILLYEYLPSAVIVTLDIIVPFILRLLVEMEHYTPNFILVLTLMRTVFLRLASLVVLLFSIHEAISDCRTPDEGSCISNSERCDDQPMCWETYVGQQLYKLTILDLLIMFLSAFFVNFPRKCVGHKLMRGSRIGSAIGDIEFIIPKHVLDIVYGQTLCWLGMFYSPLLPAVTCVKLILVFYIKYFDCTVNSSQSSQLYRTSRSNALFISILLFSFIVTIIPVGYSIAEIKPSIACGPFRGLPTIWAEMVHVISESPNWIQAVLFFMGTAGFAVPAIIILILAWYYYYAVAAANKHMVTLLKNQLILEGHDKQFLLTRLDQMIKKTTEEEEAARSSQCLEDETGHSNDQTLEA